MFRVAAIQMTSTQDLSENLAQARELFDQAVERGADLVAFPEVFSCMIEGKKNILAAAESLHGPVVETLQEWASESEVWILGGSLYLQSKEHPKDKVTNSSILVDSYGEVQARYDKMHLFDVQIPGSRSYKESGTVEPGKNPVTVPTPWGRIGLSICYDLRFPEYYRRLSQKGAEIIFIPSAFTVPTGRAHWDVLTRARSIENLAYVVCPAQFGQHYENRETYGHSRIIDPWGKILAERPAGKGIVWADLDIEKLRERRAEFPALTHRRLK
jgi:deaminated glutathione amidase